MRGKSRPDAGEEQASTGEHGMTLTRSGEADVYQNRLITSLRGYGRARIETITSRGGSIGA